MRMPLVIPLSSKDGISNKNARMTNTLVVKNPTGAMFAELRPALERLADTTGNGNGVTEFNGVIISVFGDALTAGDSFAPIGTLDDHFYDFAQSTL